MPNYASAAFSFYIIMMIVPAVTLIAVFVSGLNLDFSSLKDYLNEIIFPTYTNSILNILESRTFSSVAIITAILSFWVVSRGVSMIYSISNVMFHNKQEEFLPFMIHTFEITFFILMITIVLIALEVVGPISKLITILKSVYRFKYFLMITGLEIMFTLMYILVARTKNILLPAVIGSVGVTICFVCVHIFLSYYFIHANYQSLYGPFSAIIMILFAIRIYAEIFYLGLYSVCRMKNWREIHGKISN